MARITTVTADYAVHDDDIGGLLLVGDEGDIEISIEPDSGGPWATGDRVDVVRTGVGEVTFTGTGGATINTATGFDAAISAQWLAVSLVYVGDDEFVLVGALTES